MDIVNLDAVEQGLKINLCNIGLASIVIVSNIILLILYGSNTLFIVVCTGMIIVSIVLGSWELNQFIRVRHDIIIIQNSEEHICYKSDYVYCGDARLLSFKTIRKSMVSGIYIDVASRTILITRLVGEGKNA